MSSLGRIMVMVSVMVLILCLATVSAKQQKLTIISSASPYVGKVFDIITIEAFRRIGIDVELERIVATERALQHANNGLADGDGLRVANIITPLYPNLIMVPESYVEIKYTGFSKNRNIRTEGWDSLQDYTVGIQRGWKILEKNLVKAKSIIKVENGEQLFKMVASDRLDVIIYVDIGGFGIMHELNIKDVKMLEPPLATREMFLYLHKKHEKLISKVADALREMKADETHMLLLNKILTEYE